MVMVLGGSGTITGGKISADANGYVGIGTSSPAYLLDIDQATNDSQNFRLKNEEVSLFLGTYGTGSSYPREATINGSRADSGSLPNLRIAGQGGIKFCVDFNTERMLINSSGSVTKPYQPAFLVNSVASSSYTATNPVKFSYKVFDTQNNYNTTTGLFTAPVAGTYVFGSVVLVQSSSSGAQFDMMLVASGTGYFAAPGRISYSSPGTSWGDGYIALGGQHMYQMQANDTAYVTFSTFGTGGIYSGGTWTRYWGYLLG